MSNSWSIERNTVDIDRDPAKGSKHELVGTIAGPGGDNYFYRLEHDSTFFFPLGEKKKWVLSLRTREGWENEYGSSDSIPLSERFFAGGTTTVRGYDYRDIGPRMLLYKRSDETAPIGGRLRLVNNMELKYKLTDILRLYSFVDAGGVWSEVGDFDIGDMKYSAGIGLGVDIPRMGPVRVDYGIPINPDENQGNGRLHLMTGFRF
jgi:outer membrane protein insertion porin family